MKKKNGFSYICYRIIRFFVWVFYPKITVEGVENLPAEPCIVVGNHSQMNGPICAELYFPGKRKTWCAHQMMYVKEVPAYAFEDFWSGKSKAIRWFYRLLSYVIAPVSACVFTNADTIAVFRDNRLLTTFRQTISALESGENVIIFPECYDPHNHIVYQFQDRFIDVAKLYYKRTGKALCFVPLYVAPALKKMFIGKPVAFCPDAPIEEQRRQICDYLMGEITKLADSQPLHRVVPYPNVPKREYPYNIPNRGDENEKTGG